MLVNSPAFAKVHRTFSHDFREYRVMFPPCVSFLQPLFWAISCSMSRASQLILQIRLAGYLRVIKVTVADLAIVVPAHCGVAPDRYVPARTPTSGLRSRIANKQVGAGNSMQEKCPATHLLMMPSKWARSQ